jgi:hypothetical protein
MAQAKVVTGTPKKITHLTMGPKESQALRSLLARVKKTASSNAAKNLDSIRAALESAGFHKLPRNPFGGVVTG